MNDTQGQTPANLAEISFEDALRELEGIVTSLERGDVSLCLLYTSPSPRD